MSPRPLPPHTDAAFAALFVEGNYVRARERLQTAEARGERDPLGFALRAAIAYAESDWDRVKTYGDRTLEMALALRDDPLRRDLYRAVANLLLGAYLYERSGALAAMPKVAPVLDGFERARRHAPRDPELNLLRGYLDLLLAANLPLADPEAAIASFERYAAPRYLVDRGIALAYRDAEQFERAAEYAAAALRATPDNPEIHYLNAQIVYRLGKQRGELDTIRQAIAHFERAEALADGLPAAIVAAIAAEADRARRHLRDRT